MLNSTPAEAVVSFETMVLLMKFTLNASCSDTPAPSHPATLLVMMLLVTQDASSTDPERPGKLEISVPFTDCSRIRLRFRFRRVTHDQVCIDHQAWPVPSWQSRSAIRVSHCATAFDTCCGEPVGAAPMMRIPPPLVESSG